MARRGENIYKRKDGRWEGRVPDGYVGGKKKYRSIYAKSYSELKVKMKDYNPVEKEKKELLMSDVFRIWLKERKYTWKQSTYACYTQLVENQINPIIGDIPLMDFNSSMLSDFINRKKTNKCEEISDAYLKNMTHVIIQAMNYMKNVYKYDVSIPNIITKSEEVNDMKLPSEESLKKLDRYLRDNSEDSTCLGILLCRYTGLRIGEICALRWTDIDMDKGVIHVRRTMQRVKIFEDGKERSQILITVPKTKYSNREIPIPGPMKELINKYEGDKGGYLIQGRKMPYAEPRTVQYRFRSILDKCEITPFNFHMLRHLFATKCIALGFDINSLSEILGHSNVQTTLNLYVHSSNERKHTLMNQFKL